MSWILLIPKVSFNDVLWNTFWYYSIGTNLFELELIILVDTPNASALAWIAWLSVHSVSSERFDPKASISLLTKKSCYSSGLPLHKKWSFPLRNSSVSVTKSPGICGFGHICWRNPWWKTSFFCIALNTCSKGAYQANYWLKISSNNWWNTPWMKQFRQSGTSRILKLRNLSVFSRFFVLPTFEIHLLLNLMIFSMSTISSTFNTLTFLSLIFELIVHIRKIWHSLGKYSFK